jgi:CheY-like chemotaxis protein
MQVHDLTRQILVVDDETTIRTGIAQVLERQDLPGEVMDLHARNPFPCLAGE